MEIPGIRHRNQLRREGRTRRDLGRWVRTGTVTSMQPWYVTSAAPPNLVALLTVGVRPTCLDGALMHGLWVPLGVGVHVYRPRGVERREQFKRASVAPLRTRRCRDVDEPEPQERLVLHDPAPRVWPDDDPVPDLPLVLEHAARCLPSVDAAVLLESAVNRRRMSFAAARALVDGLPARFRRPLERIRPDAESGTETTVRWWLESRGIGVRAQVRFPGQNRRMDLLVGRSLVIECDSREFHDDPGGYQEDRQRDLYLVAMGYQVIRLTWEQVFLHWTETERMLRAVLGRGAHLRAPQAGEGMLAV